MEAKYDLQYHVGNKFLETVAYNKTEKQCITIQRRLRKTGNYNLGHFKLRLK